MRRTPDGYSLYPARQNLRAALRVACGSGSQRAVSPLSRGGPPGPPSTAKTADARGARAAARPDAVRRTLVDGFHARPIGGRRARFRTLNIVDDFTRECVAIEVDRSLPGLGVTRLLDRLQRTISLPAPIVVDNGSEFAGRTLDAWAYAHGLTLRFIRSGKPIENAYVESFNGKFRDECVNEHWFLNLVDARPRSNAGASTTRPCGRTARSTRPRPTSLPGSRRGLAGWYRLALVENQKPRTSYYPRIGCRGQITKPQLSGVVDVQDTARRSPLRTRGRFDRLLLRGLFALGRHAARCCDGATAQSDRSVTEASQGLLPIGARAIWAEHMSRRF